MGFIAEFTLSSPLVCETTQAVPEMTFEMEDLQLRGDQPSNYVFWASGGDFEQLEDVLDEDSTVADFVFLTRIRDRLLCRVTFTEGYEQRLADPTASAYDIVYLSPVQLSEGSDIRAQVPSRDGLAAYREACQEPEIPFTLGRLYEEGSWDETNEYGLTERQYDALVHAYESGYFGDEREAPLEAINLVREPGVSSRNRLRDRAVTSGRSHQGVRTAS
jgi:predicted DNA binding protein